MPKARVWMPVSVSPSTHTPTSAALTGSITVNTPPCAAGMDFSPVIHSHTVHAGSQRVENQQQPHARAHGCKVKPVSGIQAQGRGQHKPQTLISEVMRLGPSEPVSFLPMTEYAASQSTAPISSSCPSQVRLRCYCPLAQLRRALNALILIAIAVQFPARRAPTAAHVRGGTRSRRNAQLITATAAGMAAIVTPADTALVRLTP